MWAMIPMFRTRSSATCVFVSTAMTSDHLAFGSCSRAAKRPHRKDAGSVRSRRLRARLRTRRGGALQRPRECESDGRGSPSLPAVVSEGLVRLRHPVDVVLPLERAALLVERVQDLPCELLAHVLLAAVARVAHEPAHGKRAGTALRNLYRHLVVGAADAARADLENRGDRLHGLLEHLHRRLAGLGPDLLQRVVDDLLGDALLPARHHLVDHLSNEDAPVDGIRVQGPNRDLCAAGHYDPRFAPYFERACLRSETPAASSAARITLYRTPG